MKLSVNSLPFAVPPLGVSGALSLGVHIADWVQILTIVWLAVQILHLLYKWFSSKE
jgi:hypothetical protein